MRAGMKIIAELIVGATVWARSIMRAGARARANSQSENESARWTKNELPWERTDVWTRARSPEL